MPIAIAIALLLAIVVLSYRQTVTRLPERRRRLHREQGEPRARSPGLIAAAALLVDYMMTVVVSIVAGVFAITSAIPCADRRTASQLSVFFVMLRDAREPRGA